MPSITLGLTMLLACYSYVLHIVSFHRCECAYDGIAVSGPRRQTRTAATTTTTTTKTTNEGMNAKAIAVPNENDGLVWITPKPNLARRVGYEDDWLMGWKYRHYDPNDLGPRCFHAGDRTPFEEELMCEIPGYIPARRVTIVTTEEEEKDEDVPPSSRRRDVSRVIFVSWLDRRLGKAMYTSLMTLIHVNPEYEFIFFNDEDVDRFICENSSSGGGGGVEDDEWGISILSRIKAGAMRADVWRLLIMQRYGGVYVDSDISALGRLPIEVGDTAVSGVGCWGHLPVPGSNGTQRYGGVLEHWAMAFMPNHPYINAAVAVMRDNLLHPDYLLRSDTPEAVADDSATKRLTGPACISGHCTTSLTGRNAKSSKFPTALRCGRRRIIVATCKPFARTSHKANGSSGG